MGWRWVLLASGAVTLLLGAGALLPLIGEDGHLFWSDKREPATYGFDLSNLSIDPALLVGGARRDELRALTNPEVSTPAQADRITRERRRRHQGKFLVAGDRVAGVVINGEARAYPLRILNWHEVVNDTLGGVPIAVTFSGLCDAVVVFDRRVGDEVLELGTSGLLYNSNLVMYDRRGAPAQESLWSQLGLRAIAGPRVGERLRPLPMSVSTWQDWRIAHPETTVIVGRNDYLRLYQRSPYAAYLRNPGLKFPVRPMPPEDATPIKARVLARSAPGGWRVRVLEAPDDATAPTFSLDADDDNAAIYSSWFAWYAMHGGAPVGLEQSFRDESGTPGTRRVVVEAARIDCGATSTNAARTPK